MSAIPKWQPGTQYPPGSIVVPASNSIVTQQEPNNNSFESGITHWTVTGLHCTNAQAQAGVNATSAQAFDGSESITVTPFAGDGTGPNTARGNPVAYCVLTNDFVAPVVPGQTINFSLKAYHLFVSDTASVFAYGAGAAIAWYNASMSFISYTYATSVTSGSGNATYPGLFQFVDGHWVTISGKGVAPAGAAYASAVCFITTTAYASQGVYIDYFTWDYTHQGYPSGLAFIAIQAATATSGSIEPAWPTSASATVFDPNTAGVEWQAEYASQLTWTASSILTSGGSQPTFPTTIGASVVDNNIEWTATDGRVTDPNCPHSKIVTIASAKVYAFDSDIIRYSATANAQDWTSSQDAGFIPFGLQAYGSEPGSGLGLYRSNLVAFNSTGYQMWQVDPDPTNIALLDAEPVGCSYPKSVQPVNNDLVFLSPMGIRNIGTAGASGNIQAGQFGKNVDPIVKALINQLGLTGYEPKSLFSPGTGQYWLMIGPEMIVLTINGASTMSWSRYVFPDVLTDWAVLNGVLYVRSAGDLVWQMSDAVFVDDAFLTSAQGGNNVGFDGYVAWHYIECGELGVDKELEGYDLTIGNIDDQGQVVNNNVSCNVVIGYNQSNPEMVTAPYEVTGDTIPGTMIPMPMTAPSFQLRIDFGTGQNWGWGAANLYTRPLAK
jgi:hypothetical protein